MWEVKIPKKILKQLRTLPFNISDEFHYLVFDLKISGPVRGNWPNYSKLSKAVHHCHLNYSYVAVWTEVNKKLKLIEVIYVGSRENAPY